MNPTRIDILGENYFLISHTGTENETDAHTLFDGVTVNLCPSLRADFCVRSYDKRGFVLAHDPAATACAAAHLSVVRGLPLDEFDFETPSGILKILCTGDGFFSLTIPKCKVMFAETAEVFGCFVRYTDIFAFGRVFRVVDTDNISSADRSALLPLLSVGRYLPEALLFSSVTGSRLSILPYTDFNPSPPSRLLLFCAAAYSYQRKFGVLSAHGGALFIDTEYSAVKLKIKCEIK